jgi:hypothetical protein
VNVGEIGVWGVYGVAGVAGDDGPEAWVWAGVGAGMGMDTGGGLALGMGDFVDLIENDTDGGSGNGGVVDLVIERGGVESVELGAERPVEGAEGGYRLNGSATSAVTNPNGSEDGSRAIKERKRHTPRVFILIV